MLFIFILLLVLLISRCSSHLVHCRLDHASSLTPVVHIGHFPRREVAEPKLFDLAFCDAVGAVAAHVRIQGAGEAAVGAEKKVEVEGGGDGEEVE
jgi:hypothetical protein